MKKIITALFTCLLFSSCGQQEEKIFTALGEDIWAELGEIDEIDGPVHFKIAIPNDTPDTLCAYKTMITCNCLSIDRFVENLVAPGGKIIAECTYDPAYRKGEVKERGLIYLSGKNYCFLNLHAVVNPCKHPIEESAQYDMGGGLFVSHKVLSYSRMKPGEEKDMYINIGTNLSRKAVITFEPEGGKSECLRFRNPGRLEADARDTVHFKFVMPADNPLQDTVTFTLQPKVNGVPTRNVMKVRAVCVDEI